MQMLIPADLEEYLAYHDDYCALLVADSLELLPKFPEEHFDMVFADPPYFLSDGGITCRAGKMALVDKGEWDKPKGRDENYQFTLNWLRECGRVLKANGTIWISGTFHIIYFIGYAIQELGWTILNDIIWYKTNAPPNLGCRHFTHSTETILWVKKTPKAKHTFNYWLMKSLFNNKQMRNLWEIPPAGMKERRYSNHPTQKPLELMRRIILASTNEGDLILDPFVGSGTTIVAAISEGRRAVGIDKERAYIEQAIMRIKYEVNLKLQLDYRVDGKDI